MSAIAPEDARFIRFQEGVVAVLLLGGFVFGVDAVVPLLALVLGAAAAFGPRANLFFFAFDVLVAARLSGPAQTQDAAAVRFEFLFVVAVLAIASVLLLIGLGGLAWLLALALAVTQAIGAAAGISVSGALFERFRAGRG